MSQYRLAEPHPSVPKSNYIYSGRGGAGNISHINPSSVTDAQNASGPASKVNLPTKSSRSYYMGGRGGAGNVHRESERAIFSFDEELERQQKMMENQAPVYHVGRGGAGNLVDDMYKRTSRSGSASSDISVNSEGKARKSIDATMRRLSKAFSRQ